MTDTQHTPHHDLKAIEAMFERVLNAKGRVKIHQPWWWNIFTFLIGGAVFTLGWVWSGKQELATLNRLVATKIVESETLHAGLTNYVNGAVAGLSSRVNRLAGQSLTRDQMSMWVQSLERQNRGDATWPGMAIPDLDGIRRQYPIQLD